MRTGRHEDFIRAPDSKTAPRGRRSLIIAEDAYRPFALRPRPIFLANCERAAA